MDYKKQQLNGLKLELDEAVQVFDKCNTTTDLRSKIEGPLQHSISMHTNATETRVQKKLSRLYGNKMFLPKYTDGFVNLSNYQLSENQKEFLNLGLKCNYMPQFKKAEKTAELELLYRNLCNLRKEGKIQLNPDVKEQLQAESIKHRSFGSGPLLTAELQAAMELRENKDIVIRRADKTNLFVILNRSDYIDKVESLLQDSSKFLRVNRNPVDDIRKKVAKLINIANAVVDGFKFQNLHGHYKPGYFYGNVRTHKPGHKLRPIISQIPTPTYHLAIQLNDLITPYIPTTHALCSTDEFIDILRNTTPQGILASLDVESLFSSVPVDETIQIIQRNVFNHETLPPPKVPRPILEDMLRACTKEAPFRCPSGKIYFQVNGVAMGSPLGVLFAQAYMCHVEYSVLSSINPSPKMYLKNVDDIFIDVDRDEQLDNLKRALEENSCLRFTIEKSLENKIPF
ncbi:uncharacterized protein LOC143022964 [Oratosquilla oratoria]|uniref:uncharacterized protein LOC143022964 n=1 Tax=Oratosquilla oratoria TaxID=337810 RepID=UPI003F75BFF2